MESYFRGLLKTFMERKLEKNLQLQVPKCQSLSQSACFSFYFWKRLGKQ